MTVPSGGRGRSEGVMVDRSRLPEPGPSRPFVFPAIEKSTLPNGLGVWTVRHPQVPLVAFALLVRRGGADDRPGQEGLAALTADMLDEGSGTRSAIEMHEALARLGAQLGTEIGADATLVAVTALTRYADQALAVLADMVARPALREDDFDRVRQLRLHRLVQLRDAPSAVADRVFVKLLYGDHPYGHTPIGTEAALGGLTVEDVRAFHARAIRPEISTLIAVGDCDHDTVRRAAANVFGDWAGGAAGADASDRTLPHTAGIVIVPRPGAPQSELRIGHVGAARTTPDYHALLAANMVLGGQFVSRINLNLREDKGFTYGARSAFDFRRRSGPFILQASVQTSATGRAIHESLAEIEAIRGPRPITRDELDLGIAALTRGYARNFETADHIARAVMQLALYDLPDDYFAQFVPRIERVTAGEATDVMSRNLDPSRLTILVVGDLDVVGHEIAGLGLGEPLVLSAEAF